MSSKISVVLEIKSFNYFISNLLAIYSDLFFEIV